MQTALPISESGNAPAQARTFGTGIPGRSAPNRRRTHASGPDLSEVIVPAYPARVPNTA